MNNYKFIMTLIMMICVALIFTVFADDDVAQNQSFNERIGTLESETRCLCAYIEEKSVVTAKKFKRLMQDAHVYCPDYEGMKAILNNLQMMSNKYYSFVQEQLSDCQELS